MELKTEYIKLEESLEGTTVGVEIPRLFRVHKLIRFQHYGEADFLFNTEASILQRCMREHELVSLKFQDATTFDKGSAEGHLETVKVHSDDDGKYITIYLYEKISEKPAGIQPQFPTPEMPLPKPLPSGVKKVEINSATDLSNAIFSYLHQLQERAVDEDIEIIEEAEVDELIF